MTELLLQILFYITAHTRNIEDAVLLAPAIAEASNELVLKQPTGELTEININERKITGDSAMIEALVKVDDELREKNIGIHGHIGLLIGAVATSSYRKPEIQAKIIENLTQLTKAREAGITFNPSNPNETAEQLRKIGIQAGDIGKYGFHQRGLAIDLFPFNSMEYIVATKPVLEKYGLVQPFPVTDPGHFNYQP